MARGLLKDTCDLAAEILDGMHDDDLDWIEQAAKARRKSLYRRGAQFVLKGTKNVDLDGATCTVIKVNQKTVSVGVGEKDSFGFWSGGEFNVSPSLLQKPVSTIE